ncbi:isoprenylcysteine carboxylmethyltransferase family protein [Candidatus Bathyarchaeota archaeon]|nr:isoprenylcysteine carboxylmethyltransferase family protein [Candidatus Bathyarchaeota archaeon]
MNKNYNQLPKIKKTTLLIYLLIFVLAPIITYLTGTFIDNQLKLPEFPIFPINLILGSIIFFTGLYIGIKSTRLLYKLGYGLPWGEVQSISQSRKLVTQGLYEYTRNPMILGYSLLPCGMGIMFQSLTMSIIFPIIVIVINVGIVKFREEPNLVKRFGEEYQIYKRNTPFLIPNFLKIFKVISKKEKPRLRTSRTLWISLSGLAILWVMLLKQNYDKSPIIERKLIFILFILICLVGTFAAVAPSILRGKIDGNKKDYDLTGHHPTCKNFITHTIKINGKKYCAGCLGLAVGGIISTIVSLFILITSLNIGNGWFYSVIGTFLIILGLFQHRIDVDNAFFHVVLNIGFVLGTLLLLLGLDNLSGNVLIETLFIAMTIFWIQTRIISSNEDHEKICLSCDLKCTESFI